MASKINRQPNPRNEPPAAAVAVVVASIALLVIVSMLPGSWLAALPFGDSDYFYVALIALPMFTLLCAAIVTKLLQVRAAAKWSEAAGRVTLSSTEVRAQQFAGGTSEIRNFTNIAYTFKAGGKTYSGTRISIGDDKGGANLEATLKRYPVGAAVTVFYDPANPKNCVLERDVPKDFAKGIAGIFIIIAVTIGAIYGLAQAGMALLQDKAGSSAPVVVFAVLFGLALLLGFVALQRKAGAARSWPIAPGVIETSSTERVTDNAGGHRRTTYAPLVEYSYTVNGLELHGKQITLAMVMSGSLASAEKTAARYPVGRKVDIHYNPENPEIAALENTGAQAFVLLAAAAGCFLVAAYAAGLF